MSNTLIAVSTFAGCASAVIGAKLLMSDLLFRGRVRLNERFDEELRSDQTAAAPPSRLFKDLRRMADDSPFATPSLARRLNQVIEQSGVQTSALRLLATGLTLSVVLGAAACLAAAHWWPALTLAPLGLAAPFAWVYLLRRSRVQKLCRQLPEAFDVMSRAIRAGQTVPGAMEIVANDLAAPLADEFAQCYEQQKLGISQDAALRGLARRAGVMELQIFVVALLIQRRSGGNLAELLNSLSTMIRKRLKLRGRVKSLTGEGRLQALVLIVLPAVAFGALMLLNRGYAQVLLDRPYLLLATILAQVLGAVWICKIVNIEY